MTYRTHLAESNGIYTGTKVTIHGTNTGNVIRTTLLPNGNVEIHFTVRKNHAFGITTSSVVQMKNAGALGDRFINILTKDFSAQKLEKGSLIPYQESSSLLSVLTGSGGDTKKSIEDIIKRIDGLLDDIKNKGVSGFLSKSHQEDLTQILKSAKNILQKNRIWRGNIRGFS